MSNYPLFPNQIPRDSDGFFPYLHGGGINVKYNTVGFANTTAKNLFTLPKGAEIVDWLVAVKTAFNSSGTDLLDIGITGTLAKFANDLDVSSAVLIKTGFVTSEMYTALAADTVVTGLFAQSIADASAGVAVVACFYILR